MYSYLWTITGRVPGLDCSRHGHQWNLNFLTSDQSFLFSLHTLVGKFPYLFQFQRGAKPQSFEFSYLEAVQTFTSRNSLVNDKIIGYILWPNVMIAINTCVYKRLWRFLLTSSVSQKVKREGEGERFLPRASRFFSLLTINSLNTIKSFVFPRQNQHFLLAKADRYYFGFLIASDCKYRESIYNCKILSFILFS